MIGNDIVDLALAKKESNWQRNRFLDKIFTENEQLLIANAINPEIMVWNLWTRKEAAYKIYNRETGIRGYIPLQLDCWYESENLGTVSCNGFTYHTQTQISNESVYTIAVAKKQYFSHIKKIELETKITKINGVPFVKDIANLITRPVSITHHGHFWEGIMLVD
ncbi:4'-phosphopantetheinyl transferase superfamily protein [Flavobacterium omnivorum]|uniref:4'-phosphopantetheinyl transferase superfamily protein n=1 Tax=Flavobacterium omnivorum TaxID=178355 RepID=A0A1G8A053_9FLAO|nr:4'-phosphopantetheinyl transferase superfamily protein [Flavobacterium omnivorum]SDH13800.1 4'-phosphopantetheinyl transferase superfamily protein [Flavobacterium omnivorum]